MLFVNYISIKLKGKIKKNLSGFYWAMLFRVPSALQAPWLKLRLLHTKVPACLASEGKCKISKNSAAVSKESMCGM